MDEDLDWVSVSLQTVGKAVPMVAAQQSKELSGLRISFPGFAMDVLCNL